MRDSRRGQQGKQGGAAERQAGQAGQAGQAQMFVGLRSVKAFSIGVLNELMFKHDLGTFGMRSIGFRASRVRGQFGWNVQGL